MESFSERLVYFRNLSFFADISVGAIEQQEQLIAERFEQEWDDLAVLEQETLQVGDLKLLTLDRSRVWFRDLECALPGEDAYVRTVREWHHISRGALPEVAVQEQWLDESNCRIVLSHAGRTRELLVQSDTIDMRLRGLINEFMPDASMRFEVCDCLGMPSFVVVLTPAERNRLASERCWEFWDC